MKNSQSLLIFGVLLLLVGIILPYLMVVHILESTFFLNLLSFGAQVVGSFLGFIGTVMYVRVRR
jgi:hypothetical protein